MVIVLGDLVADICLRIPHLPIQAKSHYRLEYVEVGPGGALNVAITAARLGLEVSCLGQVGADSFGKIVIDGLKQEGIDTSHILQTKEAVTPVAGVVVDSEGEPIYLGYHGRQTLKRLPDEWRHRVSTASALFADGWVEYPEAAEIILEAFRAARAKGVPIFFDPGPGNPGVDNPWQNEAAALATVVLANETEAHRMTGLEEPSAAAQALVARGTRLVIVKRGAAGCLLRTDHEEIALPAFPVNLLDATGAGDSVAGAMLYGYLNKLSLEQMGILANATGAAKVLKLGTGRNMPTRAEVRAVLEQYGAKVPFY